MLSEGVTEEQLDALEAQTRARVDDAVQAALQSPYPDPAVRTRDPVQPVSELEFRVAIRDALAEELERDPVGRVLR